MARLASVSLQNSRPSLTPTVSISLIVSTPCRKKPPSAGLVMKQLPLYLYCNYNTHRTVFIHTFQRVGEVLLYFIGTCAYMSLLYMSWKCICCCYIPNYVCTRLTAASVHSKNRPSSSVCVSYILKIFCASMHEVLSTRCTDSGGSEEVRLRDGICGARDLVYFPPWIPVLPAGFSQVLASIRLGSWEERRGI